MWSDTGGCLEVTITCQAKGDARLTVVSGGMTDVMSDCLACEVWLIHFKNENSIMESVVLRHSF